MKFTPETDVPEIYVPYLDDAKADDGWKGQSTNKTYNQLRAEISAEIGRLGGTMTSWTRGEYDIYDEKRPGVQVGYQIVIGDGEGEPKVFSGRIDVAGLPWKKTKQHGRAAEYNATRTKKSLNMALFNVRDALQSTRILGILSPGYVALMPWLLMDQKSDRTLTQIFSDGFGQKALPVPKKNGDITDGHFREVE